MKEGQDIIEAGPADDAFNRRNFGLFADISVRLSVEVGSTALKLSELMELAEGSVVELDRQAHELLDIMANGTLIAKGECTGINACKGQGECGGVGHGCAGKNACKGQGWTSATQDDCKTKGGTFKAK